MTITSTLKPPTTVDREPFSYVSSFIRLDNQYLQLHHKLKRDVDLRR